MKKILCAFTAVMLSLCAFAGAKIVTKGIPSQAIVVYSATIDDFFKVKSKTDSLLVVDTATLTDGAFHINFPEGPARRYIVEPTEDEREYFEFYAEENDNLVIEVTKEGDDLNAIVRGNLIMDEIRRMNDSTKPLRDAFDAIPRDESNREALEKAYYDWLGSFRSFAKNNPNSMASIVALNYIDDPDEALSIAEALSPEVKNSFMKPMLDQTLKQVSRKIVLKRMKENVTEGKAAPDFVLPNENGKLVTLSQFRGKWVILDFWGTWCPWCIKGIPQMKENYAKYKSKLEIISIACREQSREAWLDGLKKYEMPWIQVFSDSSAVEELDMVETRYGVDGYPTKYLINPKGIITKICVGEDPTFYDSFPTLIK